MSIMDFNCHGVGGVVTVRGLCQLARQEQPDFMCIVETQVSKDRVEALPVTLGYDRCFTLKSRGEVEV
jgi:exonuclease III